MILIETHGTILKQKATHLGSSRRLNPLNVECHIKDRYHTNIAHIYNMLSSNNIKTVTIESHQLSEVSMLEDPNIQKY